MSTRTTATTLCDIPQEHAGEREADRTVRFGIGGTSFEAHLCYGHFRVWKRQLAPFIAAARPAPAPAPRRRSAAGRRRTAAIRQWARARGLFVAERGRLPAAVVARYDAAHRAGGR